MARLMRLQHPAIGRLEKLINQEEFPTVAYQASRDILDRTLGKPTESVAVAHSGGLVITCELSDQPVVLQQVIEVKSQNP